MRIARVPGLHLTEARSVSRRLCGSEVGGIPASRNTKVPPTLYWSVQGVTSPRNCSGDMYPNVPNCMERAKQVIR